MNYGAILVEKRIYIEFGGIHNEYYLKLLDPSRLLSGVSLDLPDAPRGYRGAIRISGYLADKPLSVGQRFQRGPYVFRVVNVEPWLDVAVCVLDGPFAFLPIWVRRLYNLRNQILWRLYATLVVWGLAEPWRHETTQPRWRDIHALGWIAKQGERLRRNAEA